MTPLRRAAPIAALAALSLAACGGGSDDKALGKADLVKKVNAICAANDKKAADIKTPTNIADATQAAPYFRKLSDLAKAQHEDITALKPADSIKSDFDSFVAEEQKAIDLITGLADAAEAKDAQKGAELLSKVNANTEYKAAADKLGASSCAQ
jgi:hypothetical protein